VNFSRKTLFWIIVLITLCGAFYLFEQKAVDNRRAKAASLRLFPITPGSIGEFWISHKKEDLELRAIRGQEGWRLIEPISVNGDQEAIEKLLKNVITARKDAVLFARAEPAKLKELGLEAPELEMGFRAEGREIVIAFGASGPTHNIAYAMFRGNPNVFRIHADVREEARKDVYALRDKTVLDIAPLKMMRFEIERRGMERVVIEHDKGKWSMLEPRRGKARMEKVVESLYEIGNAEVKVFTDDNASDLASYGLGSPMLRLTIFQAQSEAPYILSIGGKDRANRGYFAKTNQAENVFVVEEGMVDAILLNMDKWLEAEVNVSG
jgi:hypothetical protein